MSSRNVNGVQEHQGKRKRAKYAARACQYCQRRKIRCDGNLPCSQCLQRDKECTRAEQDDEDVEGRGDRLHSRGAGSDPMVGILLRRLIQLEEKLGSMQSEHNKSLVQEEEDGNIQQLQSPQITNSPAKSQTRSVSQGQGPIWDDDVAFTGEVSARYSLERMEARLDSLGVRPLERPSSPPTQPLTPSVRPVTPEHETSFFESERRGFKELQQVLTSHNIVPNQSDWKTYLTSFFDEVHPLYPVLHPPSTWELFDEMWMLWFTDSGQSLRTSEVPGVKTAQIFLCLALGRCTTAKRTDINGSHSAGWSFYCIAMGLVGDVLKLCGSSSSPLLPLQTLCLMVLYLFRLDANERAQNVLALAVTHAHSLGIHRNATLKVMPHFQDEMYRRIWWSIYTLDRRLCLETGRPFLILDINIDTLMPSNLSDSWLSSHRMSAVRSEELAAMISRESLENSVSPVTYLKAMAGYSQIASKVWEAVYAAPVAKQPLSTLLKEYIEVSLDKWRDALPRVLVHDDQAPSDINGSSEGVMVVQQRFLLHLRYLYMRLMIRKPVSQPDTNDIESNLSSIRLCQNIIEAFQAATPAWGGVLKFPFLSYLLGATMASLSILITEPCLRAGYARSTVLAAGMLKRACYSSWTSGKTTRIIARLYAIVHSTLSNNQVISSTNKSSTATMQFSPQQQAAADVQMSQPSLNTETSRRCVTEENGTSFRDSAVTNAQHDQFLPDMHDQVLPPSLDWPYLNMTEFDFEYSLNGGKSFDPTQDRDAAISWDGGTGTWLDRLINIQ